MPGSIFNTKRDMAIKAPVLPALTQACASRFFTASIAMRIDDSRLPRSAEAGASSIATTSDADLNWIRPPVLAPCRLSSASTTSGKPTRRMLAPLYSFTNDRAAGIVTCAPWSPPMQSMATVINGERTRLPRARREAFACHAPCSLQCARENGRREESYSCL